MTDHRAPGPVPGPAESYNAEQMAGLLVTGARLTGTHSAAAAVHLLTFTELPGRRAFAAHVDVYAAYDDAAGGEVLGAWVKDWAALLAARFGLPGSNRRMLEIAASYAAGHPVDLRENGNGLGTAHAKQLAEAVIIGAGMAEFWTVSGTGRLSDLQALHSELGGRVP